jgi:hypothetical protein
MTVADVTLARFAVVVALSALPANAAASADCRTITERNYADVKADLSLEGSGKRALAIDIMEGEVLCARVRRVESGSIAFDIVSEGDREDTLRIELQRMTRRAAVREVQIVLALRAPKSHGLAYHAALSLGAGRDVREVHSGFVEAGDKEAIGLPLNDRIRHHVLLYDLGLEPPTPPPERSRPNFVGISLVSSFHWNDLAALNAELVANGFSSVSTVQPYVGFAFDGGIGPFRAAWDLEAGLARPGGTSSPSVTGTFIALHMGIAVFRQSGFALFPMVGIAGGDQRVEVEPGHPAVFASALKNIGGTEDVRKNLGWFVLSLGSEYRVPITPGGLSHGGFLFGLRGGYAYQFSQTNWMRDDPGLPSLAGAPPIDTSGPYVRIGVGWYED